MSQIKILIVEDELIIAEDMRELLEGMGYKVPYIAMNTREAIEGIKKHEPDLLIIDIMMGGKAAGIELARYVRSNHELPFIFCTSHADKATVEEAKTSRPNGYLVKPFNASELYSSVEIALVNYSETLEGKVKDARSPERMLEREKKQNNLLVKDGLFVRKGQMFEKVSFADILWLEPDGNYTNIVTDSSRYVVRSSLKDFQDHLPASSFFRIHRSYVINLAHVQAIDLQQVKIADKFIPLGRVYRDELINRLNLLQ